MSRYKAKGRINGPFVPLLKDTMKTEAWKALSHGARSLYAALKGHYNSKMQNAVYLSTRDAEQELGRGSERRNVMRWFRELEHYGFICMVALAHHGVNGHGKAPHYRLTEEGYLGGKEPTREFLRWDGARFCEPKRARSYPAKNKSRGVNVPSTLVHTSPPLVPVLAPGNGTSGAHVPSISGDGTGAHAPSITSQPLAKPAEPDLLAAYEALWSGKLIALPSKGPKLTRLFQPPDVRPDQLAVATYAAAWYGQEESLAA